MTALIMAEILGPDLLILLVVVAVLFGSSRLPNLDRSLGSAKSEFEKGLSDGPAGAPGRAGAPQADEQITLTRAELDALIAEREARGRAGRAEPDEGGEGQQAS